MIRRLRILLSLANLRAGLLGFALLFAPMSWAQECDPACDAVGAVEAASDVSDDVADLPAGDECSYSCNACHVHMMGAEPALAGHVAPRAWMKPDIAFAPVVFPPDGLFRPPRV